MAWTFGLRALIAGASSGSQIGSRTEIMTMALSSWFRSLNSISQRSRSGRNIRRLRGKRKAWRPLFFIERLEDRTLLNAVQWVGGSGDWSNPNNWLDASTMTNHIPGVTDDAVIGVSGVVVTHATSGTDTVNSLTITDGLNATLALSAGSLSLTSNSTLGPMDTLVLSGGTLTGAGTLTVSGQLTWTAGTMSGTGSMGITATGSLNITGDTNKFLVQRTLTNAGQVTWTGAGGISTGNGAAFINQAGATFDAQNDSPYSESFTGGSTFANAGTFRKSAGAGTTGVSVAFNNTGTVEVRSGTLSLSGGGMDNGYFMVATGATLSFAGGTHDLGTGSIVLGAGTVAFTAGTANLAGAYDISGSTQVSGLAMANFNSSARTTAGSLGGDGTLGGSGTLTVTGTFTWTGGFMIGAGTTAIAATGILSLTGDYPKSLSQRTLTNAGLATWAGAGGIGMGNGATLINQAGATFDAQGDAGLFPRFAGASAFINAGTFKKSSGAGTTQVLNVTFSNSGSVEVRSGTVSFADGSLELDGSARLAVQPGVSVTVGGNLIGNTRNRDQFDALGPVLLNGMGMAATPQLLEVMSQDLGNVPAGFNRNFAYGTLALGNNTYVRLVDQARNSPGTAPEALYVNSLIVPAGATLDLNLYHVYARATQIAAGASILGGTINPVVPGPIALDTPVPGAIASDTEVDDWTFFGRAGQAVTVIVNTGSAGNPQPPLQPYLNFARVQVLDPSANVLVSASNSQSGADISLLSVALPADGTYHIRVQPGQAGARGFYLLAAWNATVHEAPLNLNQVVTSQIDTPFRVERWTFASAANQQIRFDLINASSPAIRFDLDGPTGNIFRGLTTSSDLLTLSAQGTYVLTAYGTANQTGAYAFRVRQTTVTDLVAGTAYNGTLIGSGYAQLLRVNAPGAKQLQVTLHDPASADHNELYVKFGSPPTREDYQYRAGDPASVDEQVLVPMAAAGTWYILLYSETVPAPSLYTLIAKTAGIFLDHVSPNTYGYGAGFGDSFTMRLTGAGFDRTTTVQLVGDDGAYAANSTQLISPMQMEAVFGIPGSLRPYSVRVSNSDGDSAEAYNAFTLTPRPYIDYVIARDKFHAGVIVPSTLPNHGFETLSVNYLNEGFSSVMPAPLLVLTPTRGGAPGALLTLDPSRVRPVVLGYFSGGPYPDGFSASVQILASSKDTPGFLQPGELGQVPVYWAGWQRYSGTSATINVNLGVLRANNPTPIDWNSLKDGLRPPTISSAAWDAVFANLVAQTGSTWGDYVTALDNNAAYLGHVGESVLDVSQLWGFSIQQAIGFSPVSQLASAVDAQVQAPGLSPRFSRVYTPSLLQRNELGPLGWGWTWADGWQRLLTVQPDGTVVVTDAAGSQRRFQPDVRGGYFDQPGDRAVLTPGNGGTFLLREADGQLSAFRADGKVDYVQDPNGNRISADYTGDQLTRLTHSSGQYLQIDYNAAGRIERVTDPAGRQTIYTYDPNNEYLLSVQTPDGLITRYTYDQSMDLSRKHALLSVEHPGNTHEFFSYDDRGRLQDMHRDGNAERVVFSYGPGGTVAVTDAANATTQYFFDYRGLIAKAEDPLGNALFLTYDNSFHLTQLIDALGQSYVYRYDASGNLVGMTDPLGDSTAFAYSGPFDRLTAVTDPNGNVTRYEYDLAGNLGSITYADGSVENWVDDPLGNPITWTNRRGHPIQYQNDAAGRLRVKTYADGSQVVYNYDDVRGNLLSAVDSSGTTTLGYEDPQHPDRVTRVSYPDGRYLAFQYDDAGRRSQMTDQDGFTVKYRYDAVGRLDRLLDAQDNLIVQYDYYDNGLLRRKDMGNGTYTTYEYTPTAQVEHLVNYAPGGAVNSRFDYTYDELGRVETMSSLDGFWTYSHDAIGQLTRAVFASNNPAVIPNQDQQYFYDAAGNRTGTIINGVATTYVSNSLNEYTQVGTTLYEYDLDGNLIARTDGTNRSTYSYNDENRLIGAVTPDGIWSFLYDPFGNRMRTTQGAQTTQYLIDPAGFANVVATYDGSGGLIAHYTYGLGLTSQVNSSGVPDYYDFDALGSTAGLTNGLGTYVITYGYLPFGETAMTSGALTNPFQFVGRWGVTSEANGLSLMGDRYYDGVLGRFVSHDPLGIFGGNINPFAYADNSPLNLIDPLGLYGVLVRDGNGNFVVVPDFRLFPSDSGSNVFTPLPNTLPQPTPRNNYADDQRDLGKHAIANLIINMTLPWYVKLLPIRPGPIPVLLQLFNLPTPPTDSLVIEQSLIVGARDPNQMTGPAGFGAANFLALDKAYPYRIDFENDASATAAAQRVDITDQLDSSLDWNTFELTEVGFGDFLLIIPAGSQHFQTTVTMTYNGKTFQVLIELGIHPQNGLVYAVFQTIDPNTSLPPDGLTGFLPPEDNTGRGQGHFSYTVRPRAGLPTGTQIRNIALVTFDFGETIATNQRDPHDPTQGTDPAKEALITIDAGPPTSSVNPLPMASSPSFTVSWAGMDDAGGSGIAFFDVYVSDNGGPFVAWLTGTSRTSAPFTGIVGHQYSFFSVATDDVGNREATPTAGQATTVVHATTTVTWINAAGGDWDTPSNWDLGRVPGPGDDVVIGIPGITVTHALTRADALHSLTSQAFVSLSAGSLTIGGPSVINASFTISGGTLFLMSAILDGSGALVDQGTVVAEGSSAIDVPFTTGINSTLLVLGNNSGTTLTITNGFTNNGQIELTSTGAVAPATLTIAAGTLTNATGASINCLAGAGGSRTLNAPLDNQGTLSVAAGSTFTLSGALANFSSGTLSGGTYDIAGKFQFPGAAITTNAATVILDGPGALIVDQSNNNALANFATNAAGGSVTVQDGQSFATAPSMPFSNAGTLTIAAGSTFNVTGTLSNFSGTTLTGGTFVIGGTLQFTGANLVTNAATIVLNSSSAQIVDQTNNSALANFTTNAATGSLTLQNGGNLTVGAFSNAGYLVIDYGSTFTATGTFSQSSTASLVLYGTLRLTAGGSIDGTVINAGTLLFGAGAMFIVSGTYTVTGTLAVPAGATVDLTGTFTNFSGSTLTGGTYVISGTLMFAGANIQTNAATIVLDGPAAQILDESNNDALANFTTNDGSFTIQNGRNFATATSVTFDNVGVLVIGAGSTFSVTGGFANFANQTLTGGTYDMSGTLQFANADIRTNAAAIVLDGPASQIVDLLGNDALANFTTNADTGSFTIQDGRNFATAASVTFSNTGILAIAVGTSFTVAGGFANFDGTTLTGGTYLISGTFQFAGANIQTNAATIVLDGPAAQIVDLANQDALAHFTTNAAAGSFTIENGRNFTPTGAFTNAGTLIIGTGSTFMANGAYTQTGAVSVLYQGMLILAGGGSNSGSFTVFTQGLVLWSAGTFTLDTGTALYGNGLFQIAGATVSLTDAVTVPNLELDSGLLTGAGDLTITNVLVWTGGVMSGTGATNLAAGSTLTLSGTADKVLGGRTLNLAGTLLGSGTIIGNVVNSGQIDATGILTIQGNYTQTSQGTLNITIGGTTAGTDYNQLTVTGLATLDGTLNVELTNGYMPNVGDSFQVLLFGSRSGDFAAENGLNLGGGLQLDPEYSASGLTLVTTATNPPPPGGGASSPGGRHLPGLDQVAFSSLKGNSNGNAPGQASALARNGNKAGDARDLLFQLMAESADNAGKPWAPYQLSRLGASNQ
jgi:RHS repeat-associated protein